MPAKIQVILSSFSSADVRTPLNELADEPIAPSPSDFGSFRSTKNIVKRPLIICNAKTITPINKILAFGTFL